MGMGMGLVQAAQTAQALEQLTRAVGRRSRRRMRKARPKIYCIKHNSFLLFYGEILGILLMQISQWFLFQFIFCNFFFFLLILPQFTGWALFCIKAGQLVLQWKLAFQEAKYPLICVCHTEEVFVKSCTSNCSPPKGGKFYGDRPGSRDLHKEWREKGQLPSPPPASQCWDYGKENPFPWLYMKVACAKASTQLIINYN